MTTRIRPEFYIPQMSEGFVREFIIGSRVRVPAHSGWKLATVKDETVNCVWVLRDDQPTVSPYLKKEVQVIK